jgi:hypothetical protein
LVEAYGHRKWKDEKKIMELFDSQDNPKLLKKEPISPTQYTKLKGQPDLSAEIEVPYIGDRLVPETDRRPAKMFAKQVFAEIQESAVNVDIFD